MVSRHVDILYGGTPSVVVHGMPEDRSLYALLRHNREMMLYLVEVQDARIDDPASFCLYSGFGRLNSVSIIRTALNRKAPQNPQEQHSIEFRLGDREGRIRFGHFGVGAADIAFYEKRESAAAGQDVEGGILHAGGRRIAMADRLESIMHFVPRNSGMPEVEYRRVNLPDLSEELRGLKR